MMIYLTGHYPSEKAVFNELSDKFQKLCRKLIDETPHKQAKQINEMNVDIIAEVNGTWYVLTLYFDVKQYESISVEPTNIASDTIEDYYGYETFAELKQEYGPELAAIETLTDEQLKKEIETS